MDAEQAVRPRVVQSGPVMTCFKPTVPKLVTQAIARHTPRTAVGEPLLPHLASVAKPSRQHAQIEEPVIASSSTSPVVQPSSQQLSTVQEFCKENNDDASSTTTERIPERIMAEQDIQEIIHWKVSGMLENINELSAAYEERFVRLEADLHCKDNALKELLCGVEEHGKHRSELEESLDMHAEQIEGLVQVMEDLSNMFEKDLQELVDGKLSRVTDVTHELSGGYEDRFVCLEVDLQSKDDVLKKLLCGVEEHHQHLGELAGSLGSHATQIEGLVQVMEHHKAMLDDLYSREKFVASSNVSTEDPHATPAHLAEHTQSHEMLHSEALAPDDLLVNPPLLNNCVEALLMQWMSKFGVTSQHAQQAVAQHAQQMMAEHAQPILHEIQQVQHQVQHTAPSYEQPEQHLQWTVHQHVEQSIEQLVHQSVEQHVQQSVEQYVPQCVQQHVERQTQEHGIVSHKLNDLEGTVILHAGQLSGLKSRLDDLERKVDSAQDRVLNKYDSKYEYLQDKVCRLENRYQEIESHVGTKCTHQDVQDQISLEARKVQNQMKVFGDMMEGSLSHVEATKQACLSAVKGVTDKLDKLQASETDLHRTILDEQARCSESCLSAVKGVTDRLAKLQASENDLRCLVAEEQSRYSEFAHKLLKEPDWRVSIAKLQAHLLSAVDSERDGRIRENAELKAQLSKSIEQLQATQSQFQATQSQGCTGEASGREKHRRTPTTSNQVQRTNLGIFDVFHSHKTDFTGSSWFGI